MSLSKELMFLIIQFCYEENLQKTALKLGQESGIFFNIKHFEELVLGGNWDEAENYLSNFTKVEDNKYSIKIFFEIRKQRFLEALDEHDHALALNILQKDLKFFASINEELYREMTLLLTLDNFREHSSLSMYGDMTAARSRMMNELTGIIEANPNFQGKLQFPQIHKSRLRRLINQSLNWQHLHCKHPRSEPEIITLFEDHKCEGPHNANDQPNKENQMSPKSESSSVVSFLSGSNISRSECSHPIEGPQKLIKVGTSEGMKVSSGTAEMSCLGSFNEIVLPSETPPQGNSSLSSFIDAVPKTIERILAISSSSTSIDFHPIQQTLLLVGTSTGNIELWEARTIEKLFWRNFVVSKDDMDKDAHVSVTRILWSPDGSLFGVAFSKHIVQLYSYSTSEFHPEMKLEIVAHLGIVKDLAFSESYDELILLTCGDDKLIKGWNAVTGSIMYTFEGHEAPVYSLCPVKREKVHFLFSTAMNGEIKVWLFDTMGPIVSYDTPLKCCMRMVYSADGKRLFSCGTNREGKSCMVEWNESEGHISKTYQGLSENSAGVVQFDISNHFLAAGDGHLIKVWHIDNSEILTAIDVDQYLHATPCVCFNKKGSLLAVCSDDNKVKILANDLGHQLLQANSETINTVQDEATSVQDKEQEEHAAPDDTLINKIRGTAETSRLQSSRLPSEAVGTLPIQFDPIPGSVNCGITTGGIPAGAQEMAQGKVTGDIEKAEKDNTTVPKDIVGTQDTSKISEISRCQSLRLPSEVKTKKTSQPKRNQTCTQ